MKKRYRVIVTACAALVAAAALVHYETDRTDTATAAPAGSAYRVYIDEATGGIVSQPNGTEPVVLDKDAQNTLSTSHEGLAETQSPVAGGGVMVQLDGRFQNATLATVDADGRLVAPCVSGLPSDNPTTKEQP